MVIKIAAIPRVKPFRNRLLVLLVNVHHQVKRSLA
jgi:hypothetical protein